VKRMLLAVAVPCACGTQKAHRKLREEFCPQLSALR
jgi:hypothetical protein